jgi:hypothetical protein
MLDTPDTHRRGSAAALHVHALHERSAVLRPAPRKGRTRPCAVRSGVCSSRWARRYTAGRQEGGQDGCRGIEQSPYQVRQREQLHKEEHQ